MIYVWQLEQLIASFSWREVDVILLEMTFAEFGPKVSESATYCQVTI